MMIYNYGADLMSEKLALTDPARFGNLRLHSNLWLLIVLILEGKLGNKTKQDSLTSELFGIWGSRFSRICNYAQVGG